MYEKVKPASDAEMKRKRYIHHNTICSKIRTVYAKTNNEEIQLICREMLSMAKKMHNKLKWYKERDKKMQEVASE